MLYLQTHKALCAQTRFLPRVGETTYTLIEDILPGGERFYSLSIRCSGDALEKYREIQNITADKSFALTLFWKICRGGVTPCALAEILPELLP